MTTPDPGTRTIDRSLLTESVVIMLFAAVMFGVTFTFDKVPAILAQGVQPRVFPRAMLAIVFCLASLQAFKAVRLTSADIANLKPTNSEPLIVFVTAAYSLQQNMFDVGVMIFFAIVGFFLNRHGYAPVPIVMGLILGELIETSLKQSCLIYDSNLVVILQQPIALTFLL